MKSVVLWILVAGSFLTFHKAIAQPAAMPAPLKVGYSIALVHITPEKMREAKSSGIDYIETSFGGLLDVESRAVKVSEEELMEKVVAVKKMVEEAGIEVWSIHMPYGKGIDLSLPDERERLEVVALHRRLLACARVLQPRVILFHPSYYLGPNEREVRKRQLVKSARQLNKAVKKIKAITVIENMLGPELMAGGGRERPLGRSVEEMMEIMNRLPRSIYGAVDMNHIKNPEQLIRALGPRLRSVHVADGTGAREDHYFPCSGQGKNNWTAILAALHEAGYRGPFLYETKHDNVKDLSPCYHKLYKAFVSERGSSVKH
jgi:sugar phosphate isomerase/epimerase